MVCTVHQTLAITAHTFHTEREFMNALAGQEGSRQRKSHDEPGRQNDFEPCSILCQEFIEIQNRVRNDDPACEFGIGHAVGRRSASRFDQR